MFKGYSPPGPGSNLYRESILSRAFSTKRNSLFQLAHNWPTINRGGTGVPLKNQWPIRRGVSSGIGENARADMWGYGDQGEDRSSSIKDKRGKEGRRCERRIVRGYCYDIIRK